MIHQTFVAVLLVIPLVIMFIPSIPYWYEFKNEKKKRNEGKKANYNKFFFSILATGVLCMWVFWIGGIITFFSNIYFDVFKVMTFSSPYDMAIQIAGLVFFYVGTAIYNLNIIIAGKYLRPAPSGTLKKQRLIRKGPFALIRHPLYVSYILILTGLSGILLSFWILIPALFVMIGIYPSAKAEEDILIEQLGDEYLTYKKDVGMFFPKI
jgi:protein-S-isoprenylcysteine O-methyltransferase Ste14